jgi:uncharacterized membrane protein
MVPLIWESQQESRSRRVGITVLKQDSALIAVIEISLSSGWLLAVMLYLLTCVIILAVAGRKWAGLG